MNCILTALELNFLINIINYQMILLNQSDVYSAVLLSGHSQYSQISGFNFFNVSWCVGQSAVRRGRQMTCASSFKWLLTGLFTSQQNFGLGIQASLSP